MIHDSNRRTKGRSSRYRNKRSPADSVALRGRKQIIASVREIILLIRILTVAATFVSVSRICTYSTVRFYWILKHPKCLETAQRPESACTESILQKNCCATRIHPQSHPAPSFGQREKRTLMKTTRAGNRLNLLQQSSTMS